jgi:hypothetical protein
MTLIGKRALIAITTLGTHSLSRRFGFDPIPDADLSQIVDFALLAAAAVFDWLKQQRLLACAKEVTK